MVLYPEEIQYLIYHDYTNLNIQLIDIYELELSLFYEEFIEPKTTIIEIPTNKLNILIDKMGIIIQNSKEEKEYTFNIELVNKFINEITKKY